jgi:hypothetical protein
VVNDGRAGDSEPGAEMLPQRDAALGAGFGKNEERIATIAAGITAGTAAQLVSDDLVSALLV